MKDMKPVAVWSVISVITASLYSTFYYFLYHYLDFGSFNILLAIVAVSAGIAVKSLIRILVDKKRSYYILLLAVIISMYVAIANPFRIVGAKLDCSMYKAEREQVAAMLKSGKITWDADEKYVALPEQYKHLSKSDGHVFVKVQGDRVAVFYFLNDYTRNIATGLVYISNNDEMFHGEFNRFYRVIKKIDDHWFYAIEE